MASVLGLTAALVTPLMISIGLWCYSDWELCAHLATEKEHVLNMFWGERGFSLGEPQPRGPEKRGQPMGDDCGP